MSEKITFNTLVQKVLGEPEFRQGIETDPEKTLKSIGVEPTKERVRRLREADYAAIACAAVAFGASSASGPT